MSGLTIVYVLKGRKMGHNKCADNWHSWGLGVWVRRSGVARYDVLKGKEDWPWVGKVQRPKRGSGECGDHNVKK